MRYELRQAELTDGPDVETLIQRSARSLGALDYTSEQIEGALQGAFGLDTQLVRDRTFFVVEAEEPEGRRIVACGGWSFRKTLFGGDVGVERDPERLDPTTDAAKIRAFFIHPDHARRGLGSMILDRCELAAREHGFERAELMATLTGLKLYEARGYAGGESIEYELDPDLSITFIPMTKYLNLDALERQAMESLRSGRLPEAVQLWSRALELREGDGGSFDSELCRCLDNLGRALRQSGELKMAEEHHRRAMVLRIDHFGDDHLEVATSLDFLSMLKGPEQLDDREEMLRRALTIRRSHLPSGHPMLAESYLRLAQVDLLRNRPFEAEQKLVGVVEVRKKHFGQGHVDTLDGFSALLDFYVRAERPIALAALAESWQSEARETPKSALGQSALKLARAYRALGMEVEAQPLLAEAERSLVPSAPDDDPQIFDLFEHFLASSLALGNAEEAKRLLLCLLQRERAVHGPTHLKVILRLKQLSDFMGSQNQPAEMISFLEQCLEATVPALQEDRSSGELIERFRSTADSLSVLCLQLGRHAESRDLHRLLIEHLENVAPLDLPRSLQLRERLLGQLLGRDQLEDAEQLLQEICERRAEHFESDPTGLASSLEQRADLLRSLGRLTDAVTSLDQALDIRTAGALGNDRAWDQGQIARIRLDLQILSHLHLGARDVDQAAEKLVRLASSWQMDSPRDPQRELECLETLLALDLDEGRLERLETTLERARDLRQSIPGKDSRALISTLELLAAVKCVLGEEKQAETIFESLPGLDRGTQAPITVSRRWVEVLDQHGKLDRAVRMLDAALNAYVDIGPDGPLSPNESGEEVTGHGTASRRALVRGKGLWAAGWLELKGDLDRARLFEVETCYREALEIRERVLGDRHGEVGRTLGKLAALYADEGRFEQAREIFLRALDLQKSCSATGPAATIETLLGLAEVCSDLGLAEAETHYRVALEQSEKVYGVDRVETAKVLAGLARVLRQGGRPAESEPLMRRAFDIFDSRLSCDHPLLATTALSWGEMLCDLGKFESAEPLLRRALAIRLQHLGATDPDVGRIHNQLGLMELNRDRLEQARKEFERASSILRPLADSQPLEWAVLLSNLAELELCRGRSGSAVQHFREAADIRERSLDPGDSEVALAWCRLARAHLLAGEPAKAEALLGRAVRALENRADRPLDTATALDQQADLLCRACKFDLAEPLYRRSLELRVAHAGPESQEAAYSHFGLATTHRFRGQREDALYHFVRCKEIWRSASEYGLLAEADRRWSRPFQEVTS